MSEAGISKSTGINKKGKYYLLLSQQGFYPNKNIAGITTLLEFMVCLTKDSTTEKISSA